MKNMENETEIVVMQGFLSLMLPYYLNHKAQVSSSFFSKKQVRDPVSIEEFPTQIVRHFLC